MLRRLFGRLSQYLLVLWAAITLNFVIPLAMPGDPLKAIVGEDLFGMSAEQIAQVRATHGLDLPLPQQYLRYVGQVLRFDLGYSYRSRQPVAEMITARLPWTLSLTGSALFISCALGCALGVWSSWRRGKAGDVGLITALLTMQSLPAFWIAMVLISLFSVKLGLLPVYGGKSIAVRYTGLPHVLDLIKHWLLPATSLIIVSVPSWFLIMRYSMLGTLQAEYIRTARAKGLGERHIMFHHAMRNALLPIATNFMLGLAYAISGATLIETVFSYPGIGRMLFEAVRLRDYPVIRSTFLVITILVLVANLVADALYPLLDPRLRQLI